MNLTWLTSSRAKSLATVLPAIGSLIAVIIAAFKPTGVDSSAKAYEIVRAELVSQREEMLEVRKSLVELETWFKVWREYQDIRAQHLREARMQSVASRAPASTAKIDDMIELEETQPAPPPMPKMPASPAAKAPLPPAKSIF